MLKWLFNKIGNSQSSDQEAAIQAQEEKRVTSKQIVDGQIQENPAPADPHQELYMQIAQRWIDDGAAPALLVADTILYSGQSNAQENVFDHCHNARQHGLGMWLTEGLSYAKDYCYFRADKPSDGRMLFKLCPKEDVALIEFPPGYHPANAINRIVDGMQPDVFISRHWVEIIESLAGLDANYEKSIGHFRRQRGCARHSLGVADGGLVEVWVENPETLIELDSIQAPGSKAAFWEQFGREPEALEEHIFAG